MSVVAGEIVTEEEVDDLVEDSQCSSYVSDTEKKSRRKKKVSGRPPPSPKSPYLNSTNLHPKRNPAASWKTVKKPQLLNPETSPTGTPRDVWLHLQNDAHGTWSKSPKAVDHSITQPSTPEYLKEALGMKKPKYSRSASNGTPDYKEKEDMYDEIIDLKKTIQAQKAESDKIKAKLRRLEEDNAKKDRQIEQLLDPAKDPEYARGLVDKKTDHRSIINGLKHRVLRLEQQCREKENALSQLQSDLKTTNMQEMKITVETYYEEVHRLRALFELSEKSNKAESKNSRQQNKTLSATVLKLTKAVKQLEDENQELKQEMTREEISMMDTPVCRAKGYMDWSKQRLVRRILDVEKRVEQMKNLQVSKVSDSQKSPEEVTDSESANQSESVKTETQPSEIPETHACLRETVKKLQEENKELQDKLTQRDQEKKQMSVEKDERMKEMVLKEQIKDHEQLMQTHRQEMGTLIIEINCLKEKLETERKIRYAKDQSQVPDSSLSLTLTEPLSSSSVPERNVEQMAKNKAANIIRTHWRSHRERDLVLLQSSLRGHLTRQRQLKKQTTADLRPTPVAMSHSGINTEAAGCVQEKEVTLLQSVFRAHIKRSTLRMERPSTETESLSSAHRKKQHLSAPPLLSISSSDAAFRNKMQTSGGAQNGEKIIEDLNPASIASDERKILQQPSATEIPQTVDSDDSDDIIMSPSRPLRKRESLFSPHNSKDLI
ncbi:IQ domain-containing protein E isoform X2 [Triplophysa rosa]|uniref:IQ domain-containing protein E isoform X2 n=1 Tax=Triplophysa rosa TaxID=992332 RepID=UPI0025462D6F|nr:IQ domain-containing protein E isoform X2 [Triplophysa rosa]